MWVRRFSPLNFIDSTSGKRSRDANPYRVFHPGPLAVLASRVAGDPSRHLVAPRPANSYGIFGTPRRAPREHSDKPDR